MTSKVQGLLASREGIQDMAIVQEGAAVALGEVVAYNDMEKPASDLLALTLADKDGMSRDEHWILCGQQGEDGVGDPLER